jgi:hypothetical protein
MARPSSHEEGGVADSGRREQSLAPAPRGVLRRRSGATRLVRAARTRLRRRRCAPCLALVLSLLPLRGPSSPWCPADDGGPVAVRRRAALDAMAGAGRAASAPPQLAFDGEGRVGRPRADGVGLAPDGRFVPRSRVAGAHALLHAVTAGASSPKRSFRRTTAWWRRGWTACCGRARRRPRHAAPRLQAPRPGAARRPAFPNDGSPRCPSGGPEGGRWHPLAARFLRGFGAGDGVHTPTASPSTALRRAGCWCATGAGGVTSTWTELPGGRAGPAASVRQGWPSWATGWRWRAGGPRGAARPRGTRSRRGASGTRARRGLSSPLRWRTKARAPHAVALDRRRLFFWD